MKILRWIFWAVLGVLTIAAAATLQGFGEKENDK